ncbi:TetR/AcrR family transcriptional regulator [Staphylococcus carnosus]
MLLLEKENFDKITITKICDKAGINRSTFYRNYENKEDIVIQTIRNRFRIYYSID